MNEIEKMYENAGIEPLCQIPDNYCGMKNIYEDFTAEKQIELIKWLVKIGYSDERIINYVNGNYYCLYSWDDFNESETFKTYEEALACAINYIWQSLTKKERRQIKDILQ